MPTLLLHLDDTLKEGNRPKLLLELLMSRLSWLIYDWQYNLESIFCGLKFNFPPFFWMFQFF